MKRFAFSLLAIALPFFLWAQEPAKTVQADRFVHYMDSLDTYQLVDVRTSAEFKEGHITGARQLDFNKASFERRVSRLDRNQPVLLYCRTGKRSHRAAQLLEQLGFREIIELDGGITAWKEGGHDLQVKQ
ncbi:rhodanese-like domain-containing protein [Parapedobacter lycopersici]|uniref:rhodanese-like domain-containing protein n=1 Tax=Parapedobacter lycopersici TaxID=1864939 RepID=UPI00214D3347|nr:rhodanese-like domain-containing protein [Parapedobacter lycopersici]